MAVILFVEREVAEAEVGGEVEHALAGGDEGRGVFGGNPVRQREEPDVHVGLRALLGRGRGEDERRVDHATEARDLVGDGLARQGPGADRGEGDARVAGEHADELLPGVAGGADDADFGQGGGHGGRMAEGRDELMGGGGKLGNKKAPGCRGLRRSCLGAV